MNVLDYKKCLANRDENRYRYSPLIYLVENHPDYFNKRQLWISRFAFIPTPRPPPHAVERGRKPVFALLPSPILWGKGWGWGIILSDFSLTITHVNKIFFIMEMISKRQISAISTMLTLTEVLTQLLKTKNLQLVQKYQTILTSSIGFDLIPINKIIAYKAAELRAQYNLKTPDAIQISTSIESQCNAFLTNDKGLKRVNEIQILILDELSLI